MQFVTRSPTCRAESGMRPLVASQRRIDHPTTNPARYAVPYQRGPIPGAISKTNGSSVWRIESARRVGDAGIGAS
jgi:hypothetical protein